MTPRSTSSALCPDCGAHQTPGTHDGRLVLWCLACDTETPVPRRRPTVDDLVELKRAKLGGRRGPHLTRRGRARIQARCETEGCEAFASNRFCEQCLRQIHVESGRKARAIVAARRQAGAA